jgi:hypothetical protein
MALTDPVFDVLRAAVTIARNENLRNTKTMKIRLSQLGYDEPDIDAAILFWVKHVRRANSQA